MTSLEGHVMLKKLRDALESMRGRMDGRNKEAVEKAISMVSFYLLMNVFLEHLVPLLRTLVLWFLSCRLRL